MLDKNSVSRLLGECIGVFILASAVLAAINHQSPTVLITMTAGLTLGLMVLVVGPISGSHINPAVTLGLWSIRQISALKALAYIAAQLLGGLVAWKAAEFFTDAKLPSLVANQHFSIHIFAAELVGTLIFTFGIAAAVMRKYVGGVQAAAIGGSLFLGTLIASIASNGVLNPAVAIGIQSWSWTYAIAPLIGSVIGMNLYSYVFAKSELSVKPPIEPQAARSSHRK